VIFQLWGRISDLAGFFGYRTQAKENAYEIWYVECKKFREIEWGGMDWIDVAQVRDQWSALVNTVMNLRVP
jgi:hypothetical protein